MTFLILRLKIRKFAQQMFIFFFFPDQVYLGWEELAFPRQKADPSEFYKGSLWIFSATLPRPPNITFCLESGLFNKKNFCDSGRDENAQPGQAIYTVCTFALSCNCWVAPF